jgi:hypothetical protein
MNSQMQNQNQLPFIIAAISTPIPNKNKTGFKSAIATSFFTYDFNLNPHEMLERMNSLKISKYRIYIVSGDDNYLSNHIFSEKKSHIKIIILGFENFFNLHNFTKIWFENKGNSFENIFIFKGLEWNQIIAQFISVGVDISSGSNNKKHLLSPLQLKLSIFLSCVYNFSEASNQIINSFHRKLTKKDMKGVDQSTKEIQKVLIDFAASNKILRERILKIEDSIEKNYVQSDNKINDSESLPENNELSSTPSPNECNNLSSSNSLSLSINKNGIREYHTSTKLYNSINKSTSHSATQSSTKEEEVLSLDSLPSPAKGNQVFLKEKSLLGSYLNSIKEIIDSTINYDENKKYEAQQLIEYSWIELIEEKLDDNNFFMNKHQEKVLTALKSSKKTLDTMSEVNYLSKKFPTISHFLTKFDHIALTFTICLSLYSRLNYNSLAVKCGEELLFHIWKIEIKKKSTDYLSFDEFKKSVNISKTREFFYLGDFFIELLGMFPHEVFKRELKKDSFYTRESYSLNINNDYLESIKENIIIDPLTFPMISSPVKWSENSYGGFISNQERELDIITGSTTHKHIVNNKSRIYQTVNYLNSIKFGINNSLLEYITSEQGKYILECVKADDDLQRIITLKLAKIYSNIPFFLNTHADWRGRIYTQSFFLSYQAGDLSLALLNFWEGEEINDEGRYYLYIYGANSHDQNKISKASLKDRVKWVEKNYDKIINLDRDLILSAESPFIFTAFCLNMRDIHNNPKAKINTPIFLDATCSGIQHFAALMKDLELGVNTNLVESSIDNKPGDIYESLLEPINNAINKFGKENMEYGILSLIKLNRKEIKTPIMTKIYNVTKYGISNQLQSALKIENEDTFINEFYYKPENEIQKELLESIKSNKSKTRFICNAKDGKKIQVSRKEIYKIATIINEQIFVVFPSLNKIYNYFIEMAKLAINLNLPLTWFTPTGMKITQNYYKQKKNIISVSIFGKSKKIVLKENTNKIDKNKQIQSIIPNIIHSLDASHLINIIKSSVNDNFSPVISIHDCFGTLPNKMGSLEYRVKKEFILLYSNNKFLNDFHNRFLQNMKDNQFEVKFNKENNKNYVLLEEEFFEIPDVPQEGELDLEKIIKSKYMIS